MIAFLFTNGELFRRKRAQDCTAHHTMIDPVLRVLIREPCGCIVAEFPQILVRRADQGVGSIFNKNPIVNRLAANHSLDTSGLEIGIAVRIDIHEHPPLDFRQSYLHGGRGRP